MQIQTVDENGLNIFSENKSMWWIDWKNMTELKVKMHSVKTFVKISKCGREPDWINLTDDRYVWVATEIELRHALYHIDLSRVQGPDSRSVRVIGRPFIE